MSICYDCRYYDETKIRQCRVYNNDCEPNEDATHCCEFESRDYDIKIETGKSMAEQNLPCCRNCGYIEAEYCKFHFKTIDDTENTLCTEYELNH